MTKRTFPLALILVAACTGGEPKTAPTDDFSGMIGLADGKSDAFSKSMKIVGTLGWNQTSAPIGYTKSPKYRVIQITAELGDHLDAWVRSGDGDAVAWLLDGSFKVLAQNDDGADDTLDAHLVADIGPALRGTYYIAFRDYAMASATFTVEVNGGALLKQCTVDADCVRVAASCCAIGNEWDAVEKGNEAELHALLACAAHPICPHVVIPDDHAMAECNVATHLCEVVKPADIVCGGYVVNPHACPAGWTCAAPGPDRAGSCVQE